MIKQKKTTIALKQKKFNKTILILNVFCWNGLKNLFE